MKTIETAKPGVARMYTCGPTVYRDAHIGNLRTYMMADWLRRALLRHGLEVRHIKNITDVGHMRQELVETGGDKMILAALAEGKTVQEIAQLYAGRFHRDEARLNIMDAHTFPWASHHIPEMLAIVQNPPRQRPRLPARRQHLLRRPQLRRLRQAVPQHRRRSAGGRPRRSRPPEARPPRFHPLESRRTRPRRKMGQPLGPRLPRLAYRMFRDGCQILGRIFRHPYRRRG